MDLKISFILPVYNVEAYLPHCVNSILNQITEACEIILLSSDLVALLRALCTSPIRTRFLADLIFGKPNTSLGKISRRREFPPCRMIF